MYIHYEMGDKYILANVKIPLKLFPDGKYEAVIENLSVDFTEIFELPPKNPNSSEYTSTQYNNLLSQIFKKNDEPSIPVVDVVLNDVQESVNDLDQESVNDLDQESVNDLDQDPDVDLDQESVNDLDQELYQEQEPVQTLIPEKELSIILKQQLKKKKKATNSTFKNNNKTSRTHTSKNYDSNSNALAVV